MIHGASNPGLSSAQVSGGLIERNGESYYKISHYADMPAFFMSIVSGFDHWLFVSSTGGITCGRRNADNALFPYYTDDKIHDAADTTGPLTLLMVEDAGEKYLWKPFCRQSFLYRIERNLYKNAIGNRLVFEEINHDLGLNFSYEWASGDRFGFIRTSVLKNLNTEDRQVAIVDGLRNLLPYGIPSTIQAEKSTLLDAYKRAESFADSSAAVFSMSSGLTDRAEPSESLRATVAWCNGLDNPKILLSEDQLGAFSSGLPLHTENCCKGRRGAFLVNTAFVLPGDSDQQWNIVADVSLGQSETTALFRLIQQGIPAAEINRDIDAGSNRLLQMVSNADGCQSSGDRLTATRHFSNTLFNIMRGGIFYDEYRIPQDDLLTFVARWNRPLKDTFKTLLSSLSGSLTLKSLQKLADKSDDPDVKRLVLEYLPLTFSRRHGDPSRPWNYFSIDIKNPDGSDKLHYQGNWRDIFQNWEALTFSYPEYVENMISKFVNASTADGYNPYRITKDGFEWEVLDPGDPWSNIGYWGDHQLNYLQRLIELSQRYHPGRLAELLDKTIFVFADVPYRIKDYPSLLKGPRDSITYDNEHAARIADRVSAVGSDGQLVHLADGTIYRVNLLEKMLVSALVKLGNFVPGGGIWMNTQRPEWNDANNALAGYGLSMVTLYHLRRFLISLETLLEQGVGQRFDISVEVAKFLTALSTAFHNHTDCLENSISGTERKSLVDALGMASENYRDGVYSGFSGEKASIERPDIVDFIHLSRRYLDHSIKLNHRADGLFHSYNLIEIDDAAYDIEHLEIMLEGQVAVLGSGALNANDAVELLDALRSSAMYRADQNSYMLYPDKCLPGFLESNVIDTQLAESSTLIQQQLRSGCKQYVHQDIDGNVRFNPDFKNVADLRSALENNENLAFSDRTALCGMYEDVFKHRGFTGRSGAMFKYEGLGCIYWHMVSKLLLATAEVIQQSAISGQDESTVVRLLTHFDAIKDGIGVHKSPLHYGAFPIDPYSHTPGFSGVQQPGMTGQVKEDYITRFTELGVTIADGAISFSPHMLEIDELITDNGEIADDSNHPQRPERPQTGYLTFSICGVEVTYRVAASASIEVYTQNDVVSIDGNQLDSARSNSIFNREHSIYRLLVNLPASAFRTTNRDQ